jgi:hypothetical protein
MLISESKSFLFVHVQKTAGTSLAEILKPHALNPFPQACQSAQGTVRDSRAGV